MVAFRIKVHLDIDNMRYFRKYFTFQLIAVILLIFTSCQSEIVTEEFTNQETILKDSPLTTFVKRVVMQNTSQDDFIDNAACFTVKFPYSVIVNNTIVSLDHVADYSKVEKQLSLSSNTKDPVIFMFPITLLFTDYTEKKINNQSEYDAQLQTCTVDSNTFLKINCIDFVFPIKISVYDSNTQLPSVIAITDDKALYFFIENLGLSQYISFNYPLMVTDNIGQIVPIINNSRLEDAIKKAIDNCGTNNSASPLFLETITSGSWKISYYYEDIVKSSLYDGYVFNFKNDKTVTVNKSGKILQGEWETKVDNDVREFRVKIDLNIFNPLNEDWKLFEFNSDQLRFRGELDDGDKETSYLYFTKVK